MIQLWTLYNARTKIVNFVASWLIIPFADVYVDAYLEPIRIQHEFCIDSHIKPHGFTLTNIKNRC